MLDITKKYVIASMRHTSSKDYVVTFWGPNRSGYTPNIDEAGLYTEEESNKIKNGLDDFPIRLDIALQMSVLREYNYTTWKEGKFILNDEVFWNTFNINPKRLEKIDRKQKQYFRHVVNKE